MSNMQREDTDSECEVHVVLARVTALVPEFNMVDLLDEADRSYAVTARTAGVDWRALQLGQLLRCEVQGRLTPKVLSATIVEPLILGLGLDFDGVLHPGNSSTEPRFCRLALLETWLRAHPGVDIVITSSWRSFHPFAEIRSYFSEDLQRRVLGCTPHLSTLFGLAWSRTSEEAAEARFERQAELEAWLRSANLAPERWIALDDDASLFAPADPRLVVCDPRTGLTAERLEQLHRLAEQHQDAG